jgi:indolepyruvate decarboxylase
VGHGYAQALTGTVGSGGAAPTMPAEISMSAATVPGDDQTMTLGTAVLQGLKDHGAHELFGIPGDFALPFFAEIESSGILPWYTLSHEPAVGFAADAAGRMHGGLGVAVVTYGAGALNMVNAVACAFAEKSPLVVISGAPGITERGRGLLLHHQVKAINSQQIIFEELTCAQAIITDLDEAPRQVAEALQACRAQSRPVYIELPRDLVPRPCKPVPVLEVEPVEQAVIDACADECLAELRAAGKPVILVGVEVRRFGLEAQVAAFAERMDLPVVTTFMGRGLLADSPNLVGTYLGLAGNGEIRDLVESSDCLLMIGALMADTNFGVSERTIDLRHAIVACDARVDLNFHRYDPVPLKGLLEAWLDRVPIRAGEPRRFPTIPVGTIPPFEADEEALNPASIIAAVQMAFDRAGIMPIASDMGDCLFSAMLLEHGPLVAPGYYATMGFGVPAGLGVQAAVGRRPLILVGDGAFQMTGWELGHCRRYGWNPIVLVFDNHSWEMLRTFQPGKSYHDLDDWHFDGLADLWGGQGASCRSNAELHQALNTALDDEEHFHLIVCHLERGVISPVLKNFVDSVRRLSAQKPS